MIIIIVWPDCPVAVCVVSATYQWQHSHHSAQLAWILLSQIHQRSIAISYNKLNIYFSSQIYPYILLCETSQMIYQIWFFDIK